MLFPSIGATGLRAKPLFPLGGQDYYDRFASRMNYDRLIGEWLAGGRRIGPRDTIGDLTITELMARYREFAKQHYRKDGQPTQEVSNIRYALRPLRRLYAATPAREFGPLALKAIHSGLFAMGSVARKSISAWVRSNGCSNGPSANSWCRRACFRPSKQSLAYKPAGPMHESPPVLPVPDHVVDATIPHLPAVVADMVRFHRLTGGRPGEICAIRPCDVDTNSDVWVYKPASHKTQHHGRERRIFIGPKARLCCGHNCSQKQSYCFSPAESESQRREEIHENRKTPLNYGNRPGSNRKRKPRRTPGERYEKDAYNRAIRRGVDKANAARLKEAAEMGKNPDEVQHVPRWHANQLRHSAATQLRANLVWKRRDCVGACRSEDHFGLRRSGFFESGRGNESGRIKAVVAMKSKR